MKLTPHSTAWYDRLATLQEGYHYPWRSRLDAWNGEDEYLSLVRRHLSPDVDVLDVACGHGQVGLDLAPDCRTILGYDRTAPWIELARQAAHDRGLTNAAFVCHDSAADAQGGQARLPAAADSMDLLICSKGPFHWIEDARRVARPGAVLLMLVPDATPQTPWYTWLPEPLRWYLSEDPHWAQPAIEPRLDLAKLTLHSWWSFDVPEVFPDPEQLYIWLTWGRSPAETPLFSEIHSTLARIFHEYGHPAGVAIRQRRYLWKAIVPE